MLKILLLAPGAAAPANEPLSARDWALVYGSTAVGHGGRVGGAPGSTPRSRRASQRRRSSRDDRLVGGAVRAALSRPQLTGCHPDAGRSFILPATLAVSGPRSLSYTRPSSVTMNVMTPDDRYSAG